ncbi:hypothetical protein F66182_9297 [Fusarium sp. NRRL 66182]|nr:hypothetical protein F66182_9297 [Fusarium sp. NRRL 66182]
MPPLSIKFPRPIPLEVTVYGPDNALKAASYGAKRLLLCQKGSSKQGGLTPGLEELSALKGRVHIPISCVIRPRGAPDPTRPGELHDYIYSNNELVLMSMAIRQLKETGVMNPLRGDAFVFGCLRRHHEASSDKARERIIIDRAFCRYLVSIAKPYGCVFSRAFDHFAERGEWQDSIAELATIGFTGFMTAGGQGCFSNHIDRLGAMCNHLDHIQLIVAGGSFCPEIKKLRKHAHKFNTNSVWMNGECLSPEDNHDPETADVNGVMSLIDQLGLMSGD